MSSRLIVRTSITLALWALMLEADGQRSVASAQALDIKLGSCPSSFNRGSHGVLPVASLATAAFDASQIDVSSVVLARADGVGGTVAPLSGPPGPGASLGDVGTPFAGTFEVHDCIRLVPPSNPRG